MYLKHFALAEAPFSIAPDPRYLYMSQRHKEALAHLLYGLGGEGGFVVLSGEVGAGKTTVCRCLLQQIPNTCDLAYVFNPRLTAIELLETLCTEFGLPLPAERNSTKALVDALNAFLLEGHARGRHAVLIIDEAQNLSADVLEQMRLLTNLETHRRKLLQIILVGQPELDDLLARPDLRQLAQRVVARYHLDSLSRDEVAAYVRHRLQVAGCNRPLFPAGLIAPLYRLSGGVPRLLNLLCDRTLLGAYAEGKAEVNQRILMRAASEVLPISRHVPQRRWMPWVAGAAIAGIAAGAWALGHRPESATVSPPPALASVGRVPINAPPAVAHQAARPRVAVAPAQGPAAAPLSTLARPADTTSEQSLAQAFSRLYRAWGVATPPTRACPAGTALRCRNSQGSLDELRQIDHPALLYLNDMQGEEYHAVLIALGRDDATLDIAGTSRRVALSTLAGAWSGRYTLLWRAPIDLPDQIHPNADGPVVAWLAHQLALADGGTPPVAPAMHFDAALHDAVKRFQLAHGLAPDGQVGLQTLIRLSAAGDRSAPRLRPEAS